MLRLRKPWDSQPQGNADVRSEHARAYTFLGPLGTFVQRYIQPGGNRNVLTASPVGVGHGYTNTSEYSLFTIPSVTVGTGDFTLAANWYVPTDETFANAYILGSSSGTLSFAHKHNSYASSALFYDGAVSSFSRNAGVTGEHRVVISRVAGTLYLYLDDVRIAGAANSTNQGAITSVGLNTYTTGANGSNNVIVHLAHWDFTRGWSDYEARGFINDPYDAIFTPRSIWVPVSAGGGGASTITAAAGTSTTSSLPGSSVAATTLTAAAGVATASALAATSVAAAAITSAAGTSTTSALAGAGVAAASFTTAAGTSTTSTLAATSTAASAITAAAGVATAVTIAATSTAVSAFTAAAGVATTSTLVGSDAAAGNSAIGVAAGTSTTSTLAGTSTAAASITSAAGAATANSMAGAATAAAAITPAAGVATAATLSSAGVTAASMTPAVGASTTATFAASAVAATVAIAAAGASSALALAGTSTAFAAFLVAAGASTTSSMIWNDPNAVFTDSAWWTYTVPVDDLRFTVDASAFQFSIER